MKKEERIEKRKLKKSVFITTLTKPRHRYYMVPHSQKETDCQERKGKIILIKKI
jgi:hypothetical protein